MCVVLHVSISEFCKVIFIFSQISGNFFIGGITIFVAFVVLLLEIYIARRNRRKHCADRCPQPEPQTLEEPRELDSLAVVRELEILE